MALFSRDPHEHWPKRHFSKNEVANSGRLSLDEVPQLLNVLKGDMSLVGPRPLPTIYLPRYSPEQARRHEVRPGITGWAQVHGRNALTWEDKFRYDVEYVEKHSLWMDLKILFLTIPAAFAGGDDATEFKGSNVL